MKTTLEEYLAFKTVVDTGSITAASEQLNLTISGVSRALNRLEKKLNTTLLRRTTRRLELTDEGSNILKLITDILSAAENLEEQASIYQQHPSGRLRINAAASFIRQVIVPLVGVFRKKYPYITLELDTNDRFIDLLEQRTDIAIRIGKLEDSSLNARLLGYSQLRILASPLYLEQYGEPKTAKDLANHCLLGFDQLDLLNSWPLLDDMGQQLHITPTVAASSGETLRALAEMGQGIICLSDFTTREARKQGLLVELFADQRLDIKQTINAVYYRNTQLSLRITLFLDFISEYMEEYL